MPDRQVKVTLVGDADSLNKMFHGASGFAGKFGDALGGVAKIAGGFVVAQGLMQAPALLGSLAASARDLELQGKKAATVFGDELPVVTAWAAKSASAMGLTTREATNLAAGMADLLIPMGMQRDAATAMATKTIGLAGALAEWSGGQKTAGEVSDILTKAYLGETDGLKALGIAISADQVTAQLAKEGKAKLTGAALEQAKALAIQTLVFEKSTDAQNAYAQGTGSAARQQAEFSAKMKELKEDIAVGLQPALLAIAGVLTGTVLPRIEQFANEAGPIIGRVAAWVQENVLPKLRQFADFFVQEIVPRIREFAAIAQEKFAEFQVYYDANIRPVIEKIIAAIGSVIAFVAEHWPEIWGVIGPVVEQIGNVIGTTFKVVFGLIDVLIKLLNGDFAGAWQAMGNVVGAIWDGIVATIRNGANAIIGVLNVVIGGLNRIQIHVRAPDWAGGFGFDYDGPNIPPLPRLASGGIVRARAGGTAVVLGEGGRDEAVVPLGNGGSATTQTFPIYLGGHLLATLILEGVVMLQEAGRIRVVTQ